MYFLNLLILRVHPVATFGCILIPLNHTVPVHGFKTEKKMEVCSHYCASIEHRTRNDTIGRIDALIIRFPSRVFCHLSEYMFLFRFGRSISADLRDSVPGNCRFFVSSTEQCLRFHPLPLPGMRGHSFSGRCRRHPGSSRT